MALNKKTLKYIPTTKKDGEFVSMGFAVEVGDLEVISSSYLNDNICDGNKSFIGVVARTPHDIIGKNEFKGYSSQDMVSIRMKEAIKAANLASYSALYILNHGYLEVSQDLLLIDYKELLEIYHPDTIYTYSPFDKNIEHLISLNCLLEAIKETKNYHPKHVYAVNYDGDFGALSPEGLITFNIDKHKDFIFSLLSVFISISECDTKLLPRTTAFDLVPNIFEENFDLKKFCNIKIDKIKEAIQLKFDKLF